MFIILRLHVYKAIAAIFWQSASYVYFFKIRLMERLSIWNFPKKHFLQGFIRISSGPITRKILFPGFLIWSRLESKYEAFALLDWNHIKGNCSILDLRSIKLSLATLRWSWCLFLFRRLKLIICRLVLIFKMFWRPQTWKRNFLHFSAVLLCVWHLFFNSRPHLLSRLLLRSYFFLLRQTFFRFTILPLFRHFAWNLFDFSRLVSLFSHSAKSEFEHQLLSKAIQNEQSRYKKLKSEIETG